MKRNETLSPQESLLRQILEAHQCQTKVVDAMFDVLRTFFEQAKQTRSREKALSAALLESLVLGTAIPAARRLPNNTASLIAMPETSAEAPSLCEN